MNFVTAHDGFTLHDAVSYIERHNEANGEGNKDGNASNLTSNWGVEGPTDDAAISQLRDRVKRAMLATMFLAQGTPMLLAGDEFGRTQHGNNNAYCQDNEISWIDWTMASSPEGNALTDYVARLIALRHTYPVLRSPVFLHGSVQPAPGILDIAWFDQDGQIISAEAWNDPDQRTLVLRRAASGTDGKVTILTLLLNPTDESRHFRLPAPHVAVRLLLDSASRELVERSYTGNEISVGAHSVVLMHSELEEAAG